MIEFTAKSIAAVLNGTVEGDENASVCTFAKIEEGKPGALSFLANPKYQHYIYETKSSIVLVSNDFVADAPVSATLIRVPDPYKAIAILLDMVNKATAVLPEGIEEPSYIASDVVIPEKAYIGAFAYIGKGAQLGAGVKIYPQAYIGAGCTIGEGTIIYPGAKIYHGCKIGKNCIIHAGAVIGSDGFGFAPQDDGSYSKIPQLGIVVIGDNVEIGANTTIDRAVMDATRIENGAKLDNLIQIAHNVVIGENTAIAAQAGVAGSAKVEAQCQIGGQVGVSGHITIGRGTQIGAQSGVPKSVKPWSKILGYPALPAMDFARQAALLKRLGDLFKRVDKLESDPKKN